MKESTRGRSRLQARKSIIRALQKQRVRILCGVGPWRGDDLVVGVDLPSDFDGHGRVSATGFGSLAHCAGFDGVERVLCLTSTNSDEPQHAAKKSWFQFRRPVLVCRQCSSPAKSVTLGVGQSGPGGLNPRFSHDEQTRGGVAARRWRWFMNFELGSGQFVQKSLDRRGLVGAAVVSGVG